MPHTSEPPDSADTRAYLERIAALLGRPVESFLRVDGAQDDAVELHRLWSAIEDEAKRERALAYLRALLGEENGRG